MKVIDAIIALQQLDPNMDVMIDATTPNMEMFHILSVASIEKAEIEDDMLTGKMRSVALFSHYPLEE